MVKLAAPSRVNRRAAAFLPDEAAVQAVIVQGLGLRGFTVLELGKWKNKVCCPCGCGHWFFPIGGYGNSTGAMDLICGHPKLWGSRLLGLECKAPGGMSLFGKVPPGAVKPEQKVLAELGLTVIVHSFDEALAAVDAFTKQIRGEG